VVLQLIPPSLIMGGIMGWVKVTKPNINICYLLFVICYLLFVICSLVTGRRSMVTGRRSMVTGRRSMERLYICH